MSGNVRIPMIEQWAAGVTAWEIPEEDATEYRQDSMVVFVCVASVDGGRYHRSPKDGTTKWTHRLVPVTVRVATGDLRRQLIDVMSLAVPGDQLSFQLEGDGVSAYAPPPPAPPENLDVPVNVNAETGEVSPAGGDEDFFAPLDPHSPPEGYIRSSA